MSPRKRKAPEPPPGPPYHGSTPQSVLDAPKLQPVTVSEQQGFTRAEKRHPRVIAAMSVPLRISVSRKGPNTPYVSDRVRKVRRGRKARFNHA